MHFTFTVNHGGIAMSCWWRLFGSDLALFIIHDLTRGPYGAAVSYLRWVWPPTTHIPTGPLLFHLGSYRCAPPSPQSADQGPERGFKISLKGKRPSFKPWRHSFWSILILQQKPMMCICFLAPAVSSCIAASQWGGSRFNSHSWASLCWLCAWSPWLNGFSRVSIQSPTTSTSGWWESLNCPSACLSLWWLLQGLFLPHTQRIDLISTFNADMFLSFYRAATWWRTRTWKRSGSPMLLTERRFCTQPARYPR